MGNTLEQDIRMKLFELRNSDKRQYLDDYDKGVIAGKEAVYEEWSMSLNKKKRINYRLVSYLQKSNVFVWCKRPI